MKTVAILTVGTQDLTVTVLPDVGSGLKLGFRGSSITLMFLDDPKTAAQKLVTDFKRLGLLEEEVHVP